MLLLVIFGLSRGHRLSTWLTTVLLLVEIVVFNIYFALNGGASNPFNAILLVPVVLAFMLLPIGSALGLLLLSIALQSIQLVLLGMSEHGAHGMLSHYHQMVLSFVFTSLMIGIVIRYFRFQLARREKQLQTLRERQLRDEQLLSIGTAAAQLTHDVATPIQTIHLLLEEAAESASTRPWLDEIRSQFSRIETQLANWREVANDIRENRRHQFTVEDVWQELQSLIRIARPEATIAWHTTPISPAIICADRTLLPALTSIIVNACEASADGGRSAVTVNATLSSTHWQLAINNPTTNVSEEQLQLLGSQIVASEKGHGVGAVISNATLEKFGGELHWYLEGDILITRIQLPLGIP